LRIVLMRRKSYDSKGKGLSGVLKWGGPTGKRNGGGEG